MDSLIQLLPDHIANQIAAGEVIQRPASVIKELMENSMDAGASRIDVNIKDAGKTLIQVVDNGKGMGSDDAEKCFERHATSKVRKADDLFSLATKGFRGEALASIAAIAHVTLKTKQTDKDTGTQIRIEGSSINAKEEAVMPDGTSFEVKNLFYNVPARRNFLKSDNVEFKHIQEEFERIVLAHPEVEFSLTHNGQEIHNLNAGVLRKRIVDVLGKKSNDRLVPIEENTDIVDLKGFVLKPEFAKKTRGEQYLFVNDRFFKSSYFNHALNKAFEGLLREKTFPGYFLYMDVDPSKIDVNVHPTKTEIKFEEEKFIYSILLSSVRQALGKYNISPTLDFEQETSFDVPISMRTQPAVEPTIRVNEGYNPFKSTSTSPRSTGTGKSKENYSSGIQKQGFGTERASTEEWQNFYEIKEEETPEEVVDNTLIEEDLLPTKQYLLKGNYLLSPSKSGFLVIHVRRAIEQIVYSDVIKSFIINPIPAQKLLFPVEYEASKKEIIAWNENTSMLTQLGFESSIENEILSISAIPSVLEEESIERAIEGILETVAHKTVDKGDLAHELVSKIAAAASMKKINLSSKEAMEALVEQLFQCENHMFSPRNKKIIETLDITTIDQKFM